MLSGFELYPRWVPLSTDCILYLDGAIYLLRMANDFKS